MTEPCEAVRAVCAHAFKEIACELGEMKQSLGEIKATGEATLRQATKANGCVAELYARTGRHDRDIALLKDREAAGRSSRQVWARRLWQAAIGLGLLLAGYWLRK